MRDVKDTPLYKAMQRRRRWKTIQYSTISAVVYLLIGIVCQTMIWGDPTLSLTTAVHILFWPLYVGIVALIVIMVVPASIFVLWMLCCVIVALFRHK